VAFSIANLTPYDLKWGGRKSDQPEPANLTGFIRFKTLIFRKYAIKPTFSKDVDALYQKTEKQDPEMGKRSPQWARNRSSP